MSPGNIDNFTSIFLTVHGMYTDAAFMKENYLQSYINWGCFNGGLFEICTLMYKQRRNYRYLKQTSESQRSQNYAHFSKIVNNFMRERGHLNVILSVIIMLLSDWAQACSDFILNDIHRSIYFF